jgi:glycogen(starch) synthase
VNAFAPDAVVIWGMWNLDRSLAAHCERRFPERTVYYFGDYWPTLPSQWRTFWEAPARSSLGHAAKRLLKGSAERRLARETPPVLSFPHGLFPSDFMRRSYAQAAVPVGRSSVVPGGVVTDAYRREADRCVREKPQGEWKALVAGRLTPEKGIDTAVQAVAVLAGRDRQRRWSLTIVGTGEEDHVSTLKEQAVRLGIADRVCFAGAVSTAEMPRALCEHDVFVFPSIWDEPFGRVLVEAMAARVPVVGTTVGGAGEILRDGETGLAFAPGDAAGLAAQLERLAASPELRKGLVERGQATVVSDFDTSRMAAGIEAYLEKVTREEDIRR